MSARTPAKDGEPTRRGEELAQQIPRLEMPEERAAAVRAALRERLQTTDPAPPPRRAWWPVAAVLAVAALGFWLLLGGPRLEIEPAAQPAGAFETMAVAAHATLRQPDPPLTLASSSAADVRAWLRHTGLSAALVETRPAAEQKRFHLLGVQQVEADFPVAAVSYRIDDLPVTLLVTTDAHAPDTPRWSPFGKTVRASADPTSGARVLTWRNAGKAYSLVSELPAGGVQACLICHTDNRRRRLVERLASEL